MREMNLNGGVLVSAIKNAKLNKKVFLILQDFIRSYGFMDYDTEEDFRKTLKDYLKDKDCEIEEDFITEIIKHMPFKSWEF